MVENKMIKNTILSLFFIFREIYGRTKIQKLLFLLEKRSEELGLKFEVRHYGPFSDIINEMVDKCVNENILEEKKIMTRHGTWGYYYSITNHGKTMAKNSFSNLNPKLKQRFEELFSEFKNFSPSDLVKFVYAHYPEWVPRN